MAHGYQRVERDPRIDATLTHYYVEIFNGIETAAGEASDVSELAPGQWRGDVSHWAYDMQTDEFDPNAFRPGPWEAHNWVTSGPHVKFIPKAEFKGVLPACLKPASSNA